MLEIIETIKKHGALGMTVIALIWMNSRLSFVEEKLFDCLSSNQEIHTSQTKQAHIEKIEIYAVIPNETRIKKA